MWGGAGRARSPVAVSHDGGVRVYPRGRGPCVSRGGCTRGGAIGPGSQEQHNQLVSFRSGRVVGGRDVRSRTVKIVCPLAQARGLRVWGDEPSRRDYSRSAEIPTLSEVSIGCSIKFWVKNSLQIILKSNLERFSRIFCSRKKNSYSGAKCELSRELRRSDETIWTRVAVMADGSAGGSALFHV